LHTYITISVVVLYLSGIYGLVFINILPLFISYCHFLAIYVFFCYCTFSVLVFCGHLKIIFVIIVKRNYSAFDANNLIPYMYFCCWDFYVNRAFVLVSLFCVL